MCSAASWNISANPHEQPNGYYGTSLKLNWAMDPNRGIMLAHKMNGESLRPDHGRPLRAVVPGQIGGRSVKWLTKLIVTDAPSENWYHIYDNRVLPLVLYLHRKERLTKPQCLEPWCLQRCQPKNPSGGTTKDTPYTTSVSIQLLHTHNTTRAFKFLLRSPTTKLEATHTAVVVVR